MLRVEFLDGTVEDYSYSDMSEGGDVISIGCRDGRRLRLPVTNIRCYYEVPGVRVCARTGVTVSWCDPHFNGHTGLPCDCRLRELPCDRFTAGISTSNLATASPYFTTKGEAARVRAEVSKEVV